MDELLVSIDDMKQELLCTFCSNLVCNAYKFKECSHIFCHKHLKNSQMKECFKCHKGNVNQVGPDNDADDMTEDYKKLYSIFNEMKENMENSQRNVNTQVPTKKSPLTRLKSGSKQETGLSTCKTIDSKDLQVSAKSDGRKLRGKPKEVVEKKIKNTKTKQTLNSKSNIETFLIKPSSSNVISSEECIKPKEVDLKNVKSKKEKAVKSVTENKKSSGCNDSLSEISFSTSSTKGSMKRNKKGETLLHSACVHNNLDKVKILLEQRTSPNTKDNAGWTPLHEAVASNNHVLVEMLLKHKALPNVPGPHYETPMHEAVRLKYVDIINLLLSAGGNIHARNDKGETPINMASGDIKNILLDSENKTTPHLHTDMSFCIQDDNEFVILPVLLKKENSSKLLKLVKAHDNLKTVTEFSKTVTHVLVEINDGSNQLTQETLLAVVSEKPIISSEWISACTNTKLVDVTKFYVSNIGGPSECVHLSLINKQLLMPKLFTGCHFYILGFSSKYEISAHLHIKKQFLCQLITEGGGVILRREPNPESIPENERVLPFHAGPGSALEYCAHYIIYQNCPAVAYNMKHVKSLPVAWLIECIQSFKLVDP